MSQELTKIKSRIKSVSGALKVTSAMKLVSTVKLKKWKGKMIANRTYAQQMEEITETILNYAKHANSPFCKSNENAEKNLYIVVSSTLGLCGAYNSNIFRLAEANIKEQDDAIILGNKGIVHFKDGGFTSLEGFKDYNTVQDSSTLRAINNTIINNFLNGTYKEVHLIYTEFKNSLVFRPRDFVILPLNFNKEDPFNYGPILEPDEKSLVNTLIPIYLKTVIFSKLLESEVCEQAARSNAMENATNNANDLLADLQIEFNKARQSAITQEITEIVGAAEAL